MLQLGTINNESDCSTDGYSDYTNISTFLTNNSSNDLTITTHFGNMYIKVWIDFNDNFVFEDDEFVVDNYLMASGLRYACVIFLISHFNNTVFSYRH